jgi:signal transduction histidine kinase
VSTTRGWSADPKHEAAAAIARAQADLERAVTQLQRLPALDTQSVALAVHALQSFLAVTSAVVERLIPALRDHPEPQVGIWLDGLAHATELMGHTVAELMNRSVRVPTTLRIDDVDAATLVERACAYHARAAGQKSVVLRVDAAGVPRIDTDRVLLAAVLDSVLTHAVRRSPAGGTVAVTVRAAPEGIACEVHEDGPALSREDQERLFTAALTDDLSPGGHGLALAKRFVDQLGGMITCANTPGGGTTVTFRLPSLSATL